MTSDLDRVSGRDWRQLALWVFWLLVFVVAAVEIRDRLDRIIELLEAMQ